MAYISEHALSAYFITITCGSDSITLGNTTVSDSSTFSGSLTGGETHSDTYTVEFSRNFAVESPPNLYLEITVTPSDAGLPTLRGILATGLRSTGASNSWTGSFSDSTSYTPNEYDGYNYVVEGIGSGTFTLRWNNTQIALSYESILTLGCTVSTSGNYSSVTFHVNSDSTSRYDLQFYKVDIGATPWESMNAHLESAGATPETAVGYYFA